MIYKLYSKEDLCQDFSLKKFHMVSVKDHKWVKISKVGKAYNESIEGVSSKFSPEKLIDTSHLPVRFTPYKYEENTVIDINIIRKMPKDILLQVRTAMQKISEKLRTESVVFAIYDSKEDRFFIKVPPVQKVSPSTYRVEASYSEQNIYNNPDWTICLEFHSHPFGTGPGFFSPTDENSIDTVVSRLYGNITFGPNEDKFGGIKCKFPGIKGFLFPELFFEEVPGMNDKFEPYKLDAEILEDIEKVVENNKPKPFKPNVMTAGVGTGMESHRRVFGYTPDEIDDEFISQVGEGREAFDSEIINPYMMSDKELEDIGACIEEEDSELNLEFYSIEEE